MKMPALSEEEEIRDPDFLPEEAKMKGLGTPRHGLLYPGGRLKVERAKQSKSGQDGSGRKAAGGEFFIDLRCHYSDPEVLRLAFAKLRLQV